MMAGRGRAERRRHFEAAAAGHLDVEQDEIRGQLRDPLDRLHAVLGLADDLDRRVRRQQLPQPLSRRLFIVHEQGAKGHRRCLLVSDSSRVADDPLDRPIP